MGLRSDQRTDQRSVGVPVNLKTLRYGGKGRFLRIEVTLIFISFFLHIFQRMNSSCCPIGFHGAGSRRAGKPCALVGLPSVRNSPKKACRKRIACAGRVQTYLHRNRRDRPNSLPVRHNTPVRSTFDNRCLYSTRYQTLCVFKRIPLASQ